MRTTVVFALSLFIATAATSAGLPGFRMELLGSTAGVATSIVIDSHGVVMYTTQAGQIFRFANGGSVPIAHVKTEGIGNSGLLGMALLDDGQAVVHYTTEHQTYDILSRLNLVTEEETFIHAWPCDIEQPGRDCISSEHHGGNPIVGSDGSIFVAIGDYGAGRIAAFPEWNGGKIFRILPDGMVIQFARGFRNPFDLVWDAPRQRVIISDNGPGPDDEINIVTEGKDYGWDFTVGNKPTKPGTEPPIYVFPEIVAPTGIVTLNGRNQILRSGFLLAACGEMCHTGGVFYIPDIDARPLPHPLRLIELPTVIDVTEGPSGEILFVTNDAVYRLVPPRTGDCNGDGLITMGDLDALDEELTDGNPQLSIDAQNGRHRGSWGCDADGNGMIDVSDRPALRRILVPRQRAAGRQ